MLRRPLWIALAGWAAIMATGWWLANGRMASCPETYNCRVHEMATRDAFLVSGLLLPFLTAMMALVISRLRPRARYEPSGTQHLGQTVTMRLARLRGLSGSYRPGVLELALAALMFGAGWVGALLYNAGAGGRASAPTIAFPASAYDAFSVPVATSPLPAAITPGPGANSDPGDSPAAMGEVDEDNRPVGGWASPQTPSPEAPEDE